MTRRLLKGLAVAVVHVLIVAGLGGKLMWDRVTRPRVWARTAPVDPDLPIRGRYVSLRLEAAVDEGLYRSLHSDDTRQPTMFEPLPVVLVERDGQLGAAAAAGHETLRAHALERDGRRVVVVEQPVAYFIPEHAADPSRRDPGEELWVEVTLPRLGRPRPIRLGVKRDGALTPLEFN